MNPNLKRHLPRVPRSTLMQIRYFAGDMIDRWRKRNSMVPPKSMDFVGGSAFEEVGQEFKGYLINLAELQPRDRVLDVGCGIGRIAIPLTGYLSPEGEYWGFDIVKDGIDWCNSRIAPRFPNFHFLHSDIHNDSYNPGGRVRAQDFRFPFDDDSFDCVFLTSVFTHMLPSDVQNYLREVARVLKPGSKCLVTFFILNPESEERVRSGRSSQNFIHQLDGCRTTNKSVPEDAIAYEEPDVERLYTMNGLTIDRPIHFGHWSTSERGTSYQDIVIAAKSA